MGYYYPDGCTQADIDRAAGSDEPDEVEDELSNEYEDDPYWNRVDEALDEWKEPHYAPEPTPSPRGPQDGIVPDDELPF